jgi:hypothetical protein
MAHLGASARTFRRVDCRLIMNAKLTKPAESNMRFPAWQPMYEAALHETDPITLFKLVEIAEATIRTRREILEKNDGSPAETQAIDKALRVLLAIKQVQLNFSSTTGWQPPEACARRLQ